LCHLIYSGISRNADTEAAEIFLAYVMEIFTEKCYNTQQAYDPDVVAILEKNAWKDLHHEGKKFILVPRV
jgi:hypothetical protein